MVVAQIVGHRKWCQQMVDHALKNKDAQESNIWIAPTSANNAHQESLLIWMEKVAAEVYEDNNLAKIKNHKVLLHK